MKLLGVQNSRLFYHTKAGEDKEADISKVSPLR